MSFAVVKPHWLLKKPGGRGGSRDRELKNRMGELEVPSDNPGALLGPAGSIQNFVYAWWFFMILYIVYVGLESPNNLEKAHTKKLDLLGHFHEIVGSYGRDGWSFRMWADLSDNDPFIASRIPRH